MKYTRLLCALILVFSLTVLTGCSALAAMERAEDAIENRVDAIEETIDSHIDAAEDALEQKLQNSLTPSTNSQDQLIPSDEAASIALEHAVVAAEDAEHLRVNLQFDDGRQEYEVDFRSGRLEYDYEIDAVTGKILSYDVDD